MAEPYTVKALPGVAWAVISPEGRSVAVCDREAHAERIAYALHIADESEATARADEVQA